MKISYDNFYFKDEYESIKRSYHDTISKRRNMINIIYELNLNSNNIWNYIYIYIYIYFLEK